MSLTSDEDLPRGRRRTRQVDYSATKRQKLDPTSMAQPVLSSIPYLRPNLPSPSQSPSPTRSRSRSPVRQIINTLKFSIPAVQTDGPEDFDVPIPGSVGELRRQLLRNAAVGVVPASIEPVLRELEERSQTDTPASAFGDIAFGSLDIAEVWRRVQKIHRLALQCQKDEQDEMAWTGVVRLMVQLAIDTEEDDDLSPLLQLKEIQNQSIDDSFLPRSRTDAKHVVVRKKTDLAIALNKWHPAVMPLTHAAVSSGSHDITPMSQMTDSHTSSVPLACPVEVKRAGGDTQEALLQLTLWQAAAVQHLRSLKREWDAPLDAEFVGWTVEGHNWGLFLTWSLDGGKVSSRGPFNVPAMGTGSIQSIFTLLEVLRRVVKRISSPDRIQYLLRAVAACEVPQG